LKNLNGSNKEKQVTLGKRVTAKKNGSHLTKHIKGVTLRKRFAFEQRVTLENEGIHFDKWFAFGKMAHTLKKWVTFEKRATIGEKVSL